MIRFRLVGLIMMVFYVVLELIQTQLTRIINFEKSVLTSAI